MSVFSYRDDKTRMLLIWSVRPTADVILPVFQCPCFYMFSKKSLPLLDSFIEEKKVDLIFKRNPDCGWTADWRVICNVTVTSRPLAGGSDRGERRSGELCVLAHPQVDSCSKWCADVSQIPRRSFPKQFVFIFQEAGLRPRDFRAFRCGKPAVLHRVRPLLQGEASGSRLLHGVKESRVAGFIVLFNKHEIRNQMWKIPLVLRVSYIKSTI